MKKDQFYIFVILALIGYIALKPRVENPAVSVAPPVAPVANQQAPGPNPSGQNQCMTPAEMDAAKKACMDRAKDLAADLQTRVDALEKEVTDSFYAMADDWDKVGSRRPQERELIVKKIKSDVLAVCGK